MHDHVGRSHREPQLGALGNLEQLATTRSIGPAHLAALAAAAGAPTVLGAWAGGLVVAPLWGAVTFGLAAGPITQVVVVVGRRVVSDDRQVTPAVAAGLVAGLLAVYTPASSRPNTQGREPPTCSSWATTWVTGSRNSRLMRLGTSILSQRDTPAGSVERMISSNCSRRSTVSTA